MSLMYLFKIVSLEFFPLFKFWMFENGCMVCFLYLLVEKLCHKEAHFPSTTHLSHAGQVVFLYFSLQVAYFSILTCVFSSNFTYLLWMKCTFEHNWQLGHTPPPFFRAQKILIFCWHKTFSKVKKIWTWAGRRRQNCLVWFFLQIFVFEFWIVLNNVRISGKRFGDDALLEILGPAHQTYLFTKTNITLHYPYMTHSQMLGKFEYTGGPIFKVVLEC